MNTTSPGTEVSKTKSVLCTIGMIVAIVTILAIASALAFRLMEMDSGHKDSNILHNIIDPGDHKETAAERTRLWTLALVDLGLAIASAIFAIAAGRTRSIIVTTGFVLVGIATCAVAFFLAWPLGALTALIPIMAISTLPMARHAGS
ncbi:MAG: hypothetical protein MK116_10555 [Phycisphaerales bacterium]|nr:hypothetical protein [Phycisphaerales bacterium]